MQYILKYADDEHPVTIADIEGHLLKYGIEAERRSNYRDIHDLMDLMNAELDEDNKVAKRDRLGYEIVHTRKPYPNAEHGGWLVTARPYKFDELRLLAECVNSARFLSENQARTLRRTISSLCSKEQAKLLNTDSTVVNRSKTANTSVMDSIQTINQAIRHGRQIRFKYLSYSFDNMRTQVERRSGKFYVVNPYKMLIDNDGSNHASVVYLSKVIKSYRFRTFYSYFGASFCTEEPFWCISCSFGANKKAGLIQPQPQCPFRS